MKAMSTLTPRASVRCRRRVKKMAKDSAMASIIFNPARHLAHTRGSNNQQQHDSSRMCFPLFRPSKVVISPQGAADSISPASPQSIFTTGFASNSEAKARKSKPPGIIAQNQNSSERLVMQQLPFKVENRSPVTPPQIVAPPSTCCPLGLVVLQFVDDANTKTNMEGSQLGELLKWSLPNRA